MRNLTPRFVFHCTIMFASGLVCCVGTPEVVAQDDAQSLRAGKSFIETKVYTLDEDRDVLKLYDGLRVADVSDGMDQAGLANVGLVAPEIGPLWRDTEHFTHRMVGIAVTARYVPSNEPQTGPMETAAFNKWVGEFYNRKSSEPFMPLLREGSALVIEDDATGDVGSIGSNNIMAWKAQGCVGVVTSATARDTDEIITEKVPLYLKHAGRGIRPGRNEIESVNRPVSVGGVQVMPGDVVVADGDGVIVVPRAHAEQVAKYARETLETDKAARRTLYKKLGLPEDDSVR